mmetsp:Transcript_12532/g.21143  ORF Transcript_12532/g.21143 Transcript_12532/m.21143 type:complete len:203 (-) Transcript_12532:2261-2869(-)
MTIMITAKQQPILDELQLLIQPIHQPIALVWPTQAIRRDLQISTILSHHSHAIQLNCRRRRAHTNARRVPRRSTMCHPTLARQRSTTLRRARRRHANRRVSVVRQPTIATQLAANLNSTCVVRAQPNQTICRQTQTKRDSTVPHTPHTTAQNNLDSNRRRHVHSASPRTTALRQIAAHDTNVLISHEINRQHQFPLLLHNQH